MPSVEELLNQNSGDEYADISPINDVITIDPETRTINLPASETLFGTEQEMDVERKYFKCPKIVGDNIDLSKHQIYITYVTAKDNMGTFLPEEELGLYYCEDMNVDETGNYITFSWLLSGNVLSKEGFIAFAVCAKHMDGEVLKTRWKTKPAVGTVLMTVPDGVSQIVEAYPDIIAQLFNRMNAAEEIATELGKNLAKEKMDREQADKNIQKDISGKLSEPVEGLAVGKYFRVAQIDENGHAVLEAVDAKTIGVQDVQINGESIVNGENGVVDLPLATNTKLGLVTSAGSNYGIGISGGLASLNLSAQNEIDARTTRKAISPQNIDYAVKAAMCDGKGKAWTADEQAAARARMGIPGDYELIEEIVCDGEVSLYNRAMEPGGTPYDFHSIYVELEIQPQNVYSMVFFRAYDADGAAVLYDGFATTKKAYTTYGIAGCYAHSGFYRGWMAATNIDKTNNGGSAYMRINKPKNIVSPIKKILINCHNGVFFDGDKIRIYGVRA